MDLEALFISVLQFLGLTTISSGLLKYVTLLIRLGKQLYLMMILSFLADSELRLIGNVKREFTSTQLDPRTVGSIAICGKVRKLGLSKSSDERLTSFTPDEFNLNFVGTSIRSYSTFYWFIRASLLQ